MPGRPDDTKELHRASRSFAFLDRWRLDVRLALRLLVKHRGLSLAGGFAMAVAIALGAIAFEILTEFLDPSLPFAGGDRVVAFWIDGLAPEDEDVRPFDELLATSAALSTLEQIGAARSTFQNLIPRTGAPEPVLVAEVTPSAFSIAHGRPLMGRALVRDDARAGAPPVAVIGHRAWESRFGGNPDIVGEAIHLGGTPHTIVGVMPEGFLFPSNHDFWTPLHLASPGSTQPAGPPPQYFARLRENVRAADAAAELTALVRGALPAAAARSNDVHVKVVPFTMTDVDLMDPRVGLFLRVGQLLIAALSLVVAVNLAILFYARTVTRLGEIAVRTALGAGRARILGQLFLEALAVSLAGAAVGIGLTWLFLDILEARARVRNFPFWIHFELSPATVFYALVLGVLAALVMGVLPGVKATGRGVASSLRDLGGRATSLGGVWTALVVAQVAVAVAILPGAVYAAVMMVRAESIGAGFPAERFVVASVFPSGDAEPIGPELVRTRQEELTSRIAREPGVESVSYTSAIPGTGGGNVVEYGDGIATEDAADRKTDVTHVAPDFFEQYDAAIVAGRGFTAADMPADTVVVNRRFASRIPLDGRSPLGVRFRYAAPEGEPEGKWFEIVGVVSDFPAFSPEPFSKTQPTIYHAAAPGDLDPFFLSIRFERDLPPGITDRIRQIAAEVDPALQIREVTPLATFYDDIKILWRYLTWGVTGVTASVLLLSAAGIYAMMSFVIARRTREIGIRAALGATKGKLLAAIFGRALRQLALGVIAGTALSGAVFAMADFGLARSAALLVSVAVIMLFVGALAAIGPARRGLRLSPTEALRVD